MVLIYPGSGNMSPDNIPEYINLLNGVEYIIPADLLADYQGHLISDGYGVYEGLDPQITNVGCWAHARRYFIKVLNARGKKPSVSRAWQMKPSKQSRRFTGLKSRFGSGAGTKMETTSGKGKAPPGAYEKMAGQRHTPSASIFPSRGGTDLSQ